MILANMPFAVLVSLAVAQPASPTLEERITVYSLWGGSADHLGPEFERALVDDLRKDPERAFESLRSALLSLKQYVDSPRRAQSEHLAAIRLLILCCEKGRALAEAQLRESIVSVAKQRAEAGQDQNAGTSGEEAAYLLESSIVRAFGEVRDRRILSTALTLVGKGDRRIQNDVFHYYLEPLLPSDPEALASVKEALTDKDSPAFGNAALGQLVVKLEVKNP